MPKNADAAPADGLYVGLMSGTSCDGIDAALVSLSGGGDGPPEWRVEHFHSKSYGTERRSRILDCVEGGSAAALCRLHADLGEWLAAAAAELLHQAGSVDTDVVAIGSHGHTVWHEPNDGRTRGATLQLGDPSRIAERTGINVVSDLRSRDVAAGGHGAPLVPWADQQLFTHATRARAVQNIGGMANVTWLPPAADGPPIAFDTGPGVALIDAAAEAATNGALRFDDDGRLAASGRVDEGLLARLLEHPFFDREPPRSTGREAFGRAMVDEAARERGVESHADWCDLVATLTELTAVSISDAYERWVAPRGLDEVFLMGGGARNPLLVERIRNRLGPTPVQDGAALGVDPDAREAVAFALLAWAYVRGIAGNVPEATGAAGPRVLGSFTPGAR